MDTTTLLAQLDFSHNRLLAILDTIEKSGQPETKALSWRPAPGRAHIAWQAMHCAATHDRYLNVRLLNTTLKNEPVTSRFVSGTTPSDTDVPTFSTIRAEINARYADLRAYVAAATPALLATKMMIGTTERSVAESITLLAWHEAHHQGQIHLTWNLYKAAHGIA
ncbi:MAG TPA: DinB family protein [Tepidisphaeraceae bacterium]|jgi:hypothetical protein|nr:DinB family protein [Tepidisphaeraceae bacterium]